MEAYAKAASLTSISQTTPASPTILSADKSTLTAPAKAVIPDINFSKATASLPLSTIHQPKQRQMEQWISSLLSNQLTLTV